MRPCFLFYRTCSNMSKKPIGILGNYQSYKKGNKKYKHGEMLPKSTSESEQCMILKPGPKQRPITILRSLCKLNLKKFACIKVYGLFQHNSGPINKKLILIFFSKYFIGVKTDSPPEKLFF